MQQSLGVHFSSPESMGIRSLGRDTDRSGIELGRTPVNWSELPVRQEIVTAKEPGRALPDVLNQLS